MARMNGKAGGPDDVKPEMIKYLPDRAVERLQKKIAEFWRGEPIPTNWNNATIVPLPKKGDRTDLNNWRGISVVSTRSKCLASFTRTRIDAYLDGTLHEAQCGFRSGRSTTDAIFTAQLIIERCREHRKPIFWLIVDLAKAYDTVARAFVGGGLAEAPHSEGTGWGTRRVDGVWVQMRETHGTPCSWVPVGRR